MFNLLFLIKFHNQQSVNVYVANPKRTFKDLLRVDKHFCSFPTLSAKSSYFNIAVENTLAYSSDFSEDLLSYVSIFKVPLNGALRLNALIEAVYINPTPPVAKCLFLAAKKFKHPLPLSNYLTKDQEDAAHQLQPNFTGTVQELINVAKTLN